MTSAGTTIGADSVSSSSVHASVVGLVGIRRSNEEVAMTMSSKWEGFAWSATAAPRSWRRHPSLIKSRSRPASGLEEQVGPAGPSRWSPNSEGNLHSSEDA